MSEGVAASLGATATLASSDLTTSRSSSSCYTNHGIHSHQIILLYLPFLSLTTMILLAPLLP